MKYFIITYGCQMNISDSERVAAVLEKIGYKPSLNENEANLIVINICSVRQSAVNRVYGKIENFAKSKNILRRRKSKVLLTGCILKKDIRNFENKVDYIFPIKTLKRWPEFLKQGQCFYYPNQRDLKFNKKFSFKYFKTEPCRKNKFSAFVPISTGCDNFCSYCVVPYLRGPEISRPVEDIISEVKNLIKKGYREVWLLGQNVNSYKSQIPARNASLRSCSDAGGQNSNPLNFSDLLKLVNQIPGDFWIRFISPHPKDFSDELIKTMVECKKITPYLNLPVQSGDNEILKNMNRSYTIEQYKNLVKKIRKEFIKVRGKDILFCLTTDIIVGFSGETKKQFENTVKLFKEIKFDMAYISQYSSRPVREEFNQVNSLQNTGFSNGVKSGATAFNLKDDVTQKEKKERDKILTEVLKKTALENNKKYIGRETEALLEFEKNGWLIGKTKEYKTIKLKVKSSPPAADQPKVDKLQEFIGKFVKVKITEADAWGLKGEVS
jgi:tRNA-2-methylthio-N6-dimethylallyladenosine synthase